jgi:hypothetical protein
MTTCGRRSHRETFVIKFFFALPYFWSSVYHASGGKIAKLYYACRRKRRDGRKNWITVLNLKMGIEFFLMNFNAFYEWNKMKGLLTWDSNTWKVMRYEKLDVPLEYAPCTPKLWLLGCFGYSFEARILFSSYLYTGFVPRSKYRHAQLQM